MGILCGFWWLVGAVLCFRIGLIFVGDVLRGLLLEMAVGDGGSRMCLTAESMAYETFKWNCEAYMIGHFALQKGHSRYSSACGLTEPKTYGSRSTN